MFVVVMDKATVFVFVTVIFSVTNADLKSGKAPTISLSDGFEIPLLGLGTSVRDGDPDDIRTAVELAIEAGYRHFDTAARYGTEGVVGQAVRAKVEDGTIHRPDVFITTKLWNNNHRREQVIPALRQSLEKLATDYVDLYLVHTPISLHENGEYSHTDFVDTWKGMEEVHRLGLARSIGVSNFNETQLIKLLAACTIKPVVNQIEVNPHLTQKKLIGFCGERGIQVVAYSPLGSMPESRFKLNNRPPKRPPLIDDPIITQIGNRYNKTTVQITLRYLLDSDLIPIPKAVTPTHIRQNIDVFDFKLTPEEIEKIDSFNLDYRIVNPKEWQDSPFYPFIN